jgi:glutamyl-tRNA synthetase
MAEMCWYCYHPIDAIQPEAAKKHLRPVILDAMTDVLTRFTALAHWRRPDIAEVIEATAAQFEMNMGKLGQPLRVAVTGGPVSPPIDTTLALVGREKTLIRVADGIAFIRARAAASQ